MNLLDARFVAEKNICDGLISGDADVLLDGLLRLPELLKDTNKNASQILRDAVKYGMENAYLTNTLKERSSLLIRSMEILNNDWDNSTSDTIRPYIWDAVLHISKVMRVFKIIDEANQNEIASSIIKNITITAHLMDELLKSESLNGKKCEQRLKILNVLSDFLNPRDNFAFRAEVEAALGKPFPNKTLDNLTTIIAFKTANDLTTAIDNEDIELILFLINKGADLNAGPYLHSVLKSSLINNSILDILLNSGANPNFLDDSNRSPLNVLIERRPSPLSNGIGDEREKKALFSLLKYGADSSSLLYNNEYQKFFSTSPIFEMIPIFSKMIEEGKEFDAVALQGKNKPKVRI